MNWVKRIFKIFSWIVNNVKITNSNYSNSHDCNNETRINPATGLPMVNGSLDVAGNPFGAKLSDLHRHNHHHDYSGQNSINTSGGYDPFNNRY